MLRHLYIRHFAIIDELELDLSTGLTALTGETGAGKSILLGALNLVLGDRADNDSIKQGHDFAEIVAEFDVSNLPDVSSWLVSQELNTDDECILRRRISRDGRSRAYINSTPVNLQVIRELAEMLIDIHGQHEHQSMMKPAIQRQLLDDYANHRPLLESVSNLFVELKLIEDQLDHLTQSSNEQSDRVDLLRFQTQELEALSLEENEYQELSQQHLRMANAEKLHNSIQQAVYRLSDDDNQNIQSSISQIIHTLNDAASIDGSLQPVTDMLAEARIQIEESVSSLKNYLDDIDLDTQQLSTIEQRIQNIIDLSRKHRVEPDILHTMLETLQHELDSIEHVDERLEELRQKQQALETEYLEACSQLSISRNKAATRLNKQITQSLQTLGMSGGKFEIALSSSDDNRAAHGLDKIEFTVTANAGQACKPVARVASGGELARISLAIQMIISNSSRVPTMIFDEVDSGVGGGIAEIVGQHLRILGQAHDKRETQVICITHLPQVASQAHQHMRVEKQTLNKMTSSRVIMLDDEQRRTEIARMLSGVKITEQSLAHADDMIERAQSV